VEDEPTISHAVATRLRAEGYQVETAADGPSAVEAAERLRPAAIVLDVMLPGFDGLEVCRRVQAARPVPVLMLTARDDETDMLVGLGVGADDYMTKPFSMRELVARVNALVRRVERARLLADSGAAHDLSPVSIGDVEIDRAERRVRRDGTEVHLTPTEWGMLEMLVRNRGKLVGREELLKEVWGPAYAKETHYLRVYLAQLRRKLENDPSRPVHLITEAGMGYRFQQ
jgi:DNA-binding response OmpR family regulator